VSLRIVSDAAGRVRFATPALGGSPALAVALEDAVDPVAGVRQVPVYPPSGNVVVWFDPALVPSRGCLIMSWSGVGCTWPATPRARLLVQVVAL
jgi:hypothetical protein